MLRILIADEHEVTRNGLRVHLESQSGWQVVAEAATGPDAIHKATETSPDVAIAAYELPEVDGIEVTRHIKARAPKTEVLIYTAYNTGSILGHLLDAGAKGCVLKSEPMSQLVEAVRQVAARKPYFAGTLPIENMQKNTGTVTRLSLRELSVVRLVAEGHTNKEAARVLGISLKTVETHRLNAMNKLELGSSADLVRYAVRNHIVQA